MPTLAAAAPELHIEIAENSPPPPPPPAPRSAPTQAVRESTSSSEGTDGEVSDEPVRNLQLVPQAISRQEQPRSTFGMVSLPPDLTHMDDPMLSCRILLHVVEGSAGSCTAIALLSASASWQLDSWRWLFLLLKFAIASVKACLAMHMAFRFASARRTDSVSSFFDSYAVKALWRRSVRLFPAISLCLAKCYFVSICFVIVEVSTGEDRSQAGPTGHLLFLYISMFLYSILLFLESYSAPRRLIAFAQQRSVEAEVRRWQWNSMEVVTNAKTQLPPPPPSGRIRTGRYGKLMPHAAIEMGSSFSTCTICLDCFHETDDAARLPCGHIFHSDCLREWLRVRLQCPYRCPVALGGVQANGMQQVARHDTNRLRRADHQEQGYTERINPHMSRLPTRMNYGVTGHALDV